MKEIIARVGDILMQSGIESMCLTGEEIIRCKDCRYHNSEPDTHGDYCDKIHRSKGPNWFCGDGRRREV